MTDTTLPDTLDELADLIDKVGDRLDTIAAALDRLPAPPGLAYHPERVGCMDEVRVGDRAMWDGRWHEVTDILGDADNVYLHTDDGAEPLVLPGRYGVRFQALDRGEEWGA